MIFNLFHFGSVGKGTKGKKARGQSISWSSWLVDRQGVNWRFRLPEITLQKCPHLDSFNPASGAKFYNWKDVTLKQLERHQATSAHRLELTKTLLDKKHLYLVSHCQDAEEIFDILEQKIPPKSEICRHLEDRIALGGQALGKEATGQYFLFTHQM